MRKSRFLPKLFLLLSLIIAVSSCNNKLIRNEPKYRHEAGTVHISVLSVAPWEKYVSELQPVFNMSPEKALEDVVPTTTIMDEKIIDAIGLSARVALARGEKTGDLSSVPSDKPLEGVGTASGLPDAGDGKEREVAIDPMLRHLAATALYQEVKLINHYLEDAAVYEKDFTPYVVRLQIGLMPTRRDLQYDVYTTMSFFTNSQTPEVRLEKQAEVTAVPTPTDDPPAQNQGDRWSLKVKWDEFKCAGRSPNCKTPIVLPLLVTDNLERILHSRSEERIRQYALALSAILEGVGLGGNFQSLDNKLLKIFGTDFNSLLTVGSVTNNTVKVRLGAMKQVAEKDCHAMVPRTHNITLLVLVPDEERRMAVLADTMMMHVKRGTILESANPSYVEKKIHDIANNYGVESFEKCIDLLTLTQVNRWDDFIEICKKSTIYNGIYCNTLWLELAAANQYSTFASAEFGLPPVPEPAIANTQSVLFFDNEEKGAVARLGGTTNIVPNNLSAILYMKPECTVPQLTKAQYECADENECQDKRKCQNVENYYPFVASDIGITENGRTIDITLPSLKALGFKKEGDCDLKLEVTYKRWHDEKDDPTYRNCFENILYIEREKAEEEEKHPGFSVAVNSKVIVVEDDKGNVDLVLKKAKEGGAEKIFFDMFKEKVERITDVTDPEKEANIPWDNKNKKWYINSDGKVRIYFKNLQKNTEVVIRLHNEKDVRHDDISLLVQ
jgi:hypothetical protein